MNSPFTLQSRITKTLLIVACLIFVGAAGVIGWLRYNEVKENIARVMLGQIKIAQSLIRGQVMQYDSRMLQISIDLVGKDDRQVLDETKSHLSNYDPFDVYYVLDKDGKIVLISDRFNNYLGFNPSNMEHIQHAGKISNVFQSVFSHRSVIALQYPLNDHLRLIYERDIQNILPVMQHMEKGRFADDQLLFILSAEGIVVYHPDVSLVKSRYNLGFDLKNRSASDPYSLFTYDAHGEKFFVCSADLQVPEGWVVYLQMPARLFIDKIVRGIAFQLAGLMIIVLTVIFSVHIVMRRFFSQPVGDIVRSLENYDPAGDLVPFPAEVDNEIMEFSHITGAVNRMAEAIAHSNLLLRESEEHSRLLLNSTAEAIYGLDLDGKCTFCNAAFLRLMGYEREVDLLGKNMHDLIHHTRSNGFIYPVCDCSIFQSLLHGKEVYSENDVFWRSDGTSIPVQYWSHPTRVDGKITGAVVTFLDISDRKKADNERNTAVERFKILVDSLDLLVYVADMNTYEILFVNKFGENIWPGCVGKICWQTLQQDQNGPCEFCTNDRLLDAESNPAGVYIWEFQNTVNKRWYECRDQAIKWIDGRMVRLEIATDITQRKNDEKEREKLEARMHQSQKMESIGTLAGGIAHDFNNILSAILGFSELARRDKDNSNELLSHLDEVVGSANRAKDLVRQILTFSRRTEQKKQLLQVSLVVKETLRLLRSSIPATIEIREQILSSATALADPTQMHQIIMNLCTNAYYAMRETGGILSVFLDNIELFQGDGLPVPGMEPGKYIHLAVVDNGCGMDQTTVANAFEPYFTTKDAGEGTGLGLAVVHGIIESHNGHIVVESTPGKGTTFDVYLPLVEKEADDFVLDSQGTPLVGGNERIMFVDDEEKIAAMATKLLTGHGYQVATFLNAQQALHEFKKSPDQFDLVITDMTMPYMTGAVLAQRLLELRPALPVVLCTGHSDIINREKALAMGIVEYCEKPLSLEKMLVAARSALDHGKARGARVLFVDDDQCNIDLGIAMLESVGCQVSGITDSQKALALFADAPEQFDVVITDQMMPELDGFELAQQLLAIRPELTICMLTGNESIAYREKAESVGIKEFITKPLDMNCLIRVVGDVVN